MTVLMENIVNKMLKHKKLNLKNLEGKEEAKRNIKFHMLNNKNKQKEKLILMISDLF